MNFVNIRISREFSINSMHRIRAARPGKTYRIRLVKSKAEASAVLASIGLTVSDVVRLMLQRVATKKALPFEPLIPNSETIEALEECRRGGLKQYNSIEDLIHELHEEN